MGCFQSKGNAATYECSPGVEAARTINDAKAFYRLSPDCIGAIYAKLESPVDRCSFYHSCQAGEFVGQLTRGLSFAVLCRDEWSTCNQSRAVLRTEFSTVSCV